MLTRGLNPGAMEQLNDTMWRAGKVTWSSLGKQSNILGMESIHVFGREDRIEDGLRIKSIGKGQLHKNSMHRIVTVQLLDFFHQGFLRNVGG